MTLHIKLEFFGKEEFNYEILNCQKLKQQNKENLDIKTKF